ncbi:MAG: YraN family protein [Candidatus Sungbacteria bacterium]|nr:YraN family protein [Candidatus Sungbacteria bacterium]
MPKTKKREFGDMGEKIAEMYLVDNGYRVIEKNYEITKTGEIDIVGEKNGVLIFFEVKTRDVTHETNFPIAFSISFDKKKRIRRTCEIYLQQNEDVAKNKEWRVDAIFVSFDTKSDEHKIEHIENILWEKYY